MKIDYKTIENIIKEMEEISYIRFEDFPSIELYMDQVTSFIEDKLSENKRYKDDKILTKTMINNYAKNNLFPSPIKKKYTKNHLILFSIIYYLKSFLSINDIKTILIGLQEDTDLELFYKNIVTTIKSNISSTSGDITAKLETSFNIKNDRLDNEPIYSFISQLSYDIYVRKQLIEKLVDLLNNEDK